VDGGSLRHAAAPTSWSEEGRSSIRSAAKRTARSGWSVSSTDVSAVGNRPSETVIRSHPTTCELSARTMSQAVAARDGVKSRSPITSPIGTMQTVLASVAS
jgi:hypothetical protein